MFCFFVFFFERLGKQVFIFYLEWNVNKVHSERIQLAYIFFLLSTLCKHVKINEFVDLSNRPFAFIFSCFLFLIRWNRPKTRQAKKSLKNCCFFSASQYYNDFPRDLLLWITTMDVVMAWMLHCVFFFEDFCAIKVPVLNIIIMQ